MTRPSERTSPQSSGAPLVGKTFLLGVGAQKSGTSWVYRHFARHPEAAFPGTKELHVFNVAFQSRLFGHFGTDTLRRLLQALDAQEDGGVIRPKPPLPELRAIAAAQVDVARYPQIFAHTGDARLTGDITPEYAALSAEQFRQVRAMLLAAGAVPRVVFLMRDPVDRAYSSARMWARRNRVEDPAQIHAHLRSKLGAKTHLARGRYDQTVKALEEAFAPEELFFGFYETLFNQATLDRLSAHLGVAARPGDFDTPVNVTTSAGPLPEALAAETRRVFAPVYAFCRQRFGADLPASWAEPST